MRLIDADALLKASRIGKVLYFNDTVTDGYTDVLLAVDVEYAPTVEVEPVKHGYWIREYLGYGAHRYKCSVCGGRFGEDAIDDFEHNHYCADCGAKMDGEQK